MNPESALRQLAGLRVIIGLAALLAPRLAARLFGLDPDANPQAAYLGRLFGVRDVALGVGALASNGAARRNWVLLGIGVDATDAVSAGLAGRDGSVTTFTAAKLAVPAVAAAALGVVAQGGGSDTGPTQA
jgi:uncharacterized protein DUF4267